MEPWNTDVEGELTLELINSDERTIRVEAGPGTGKTFGLVRRVLRLVHPQGLAVSGREVLIVAFNRVIAKDLAAAVTATLEDAELDCEPVIRTVHGLCLQLVGSTLRLLLPHERDAMLYDVLHAHPQLAMTQPQAETALHQHEANLSQHIPLWQAVGRWLTRHKASLISDLPRLILDKLHAGDYDGTRYTHVIVDEYQDLTPSEQELFMKLRSDGGSIVVLGDPKQSIYGFRGNDREGLNKLEQLDPDATVTDIPIDECRRCPAPMVSAANTLMTLYPPPMKPANDNPANIHVVYWSTPRAEAEGLAPHILSNMAAHPNTRHLAMVTRRRFGYMLRDAIKAINPDISIDLSFSESLLETWPVREAFLFFSLLVAPDAPTWRGWLSYKTPQDDGTGFNAPKRNAPAYLRFLEAHDDSITIPAIEALVAEPRATARGQGGSYLWDRAKRFLDLRASIQIDDEDDVSAVLDKLFSPDVWLLGASETTILDFERLRDTTTAIADELATDDPDLDRSNQLKALAERLRYMIATREPFEAEHTHDLQITTLWGAKGVTADHVYLIGLCGEALPGQRRPEYLGTDEQYREEQRRLFYVSITRSKKTLVFSRPQRVRPGDARQLGLALGGGSGYWATLQMCPFVRDISADLPAAVDGQTWGGPD